jgi:DNA-directed RNA polymerase subunit RPC12/RpoP
MSDLKHTESKGHLPDARYACVRCGSTFAKEKELKGHSKECDVTVSKRLEEVVKSMATLFTSHVEMAKKISDMERAQKGEPPEELGIAPNDVDDSACYAVRDGKLYKYSKGAKTYALVDVAAMISALVTRDYAQLL